MRDEMKTRVFTVLTQHIGLTSGMSAEALAHAAGVKERDVRLAVSALREEGFGVCAHPQTGYFIAETDAELQKYFIDFMFDRAMHTLRLVSKVTKQALPDLVGQLKLKT